MSETRTQRLLAVGWSLLLVLSMVGVGVGGMSGSVTAQTLAGDGTPDNPYLIESATDLEEVRTNLSAHYRLTSDLDLSGTSNFEPIANGTEFTGSFDGNGSTISNLHINRPASEQVGLFAKIGTNGSVSNLTLSSVDVTGGEEVGALGGVQHRHGGRRDGQRDRHGYPK